MNSPLSVWRAGDAATRTFVLLQLALAVISYVATTWGFIDLMKIDLLHEIQSGTLDGGDIVGTVIVIAIASAVVVTMLIGLSAMLDRDRGFIGRFVGGIVYAFFVFWSIAFGYGFFWKTLASEEFTRANFQRQAEQIESTIDGVMNSLTGVVKTTQDASNEAARLSLEESRQDGGGTCQNNPDSIGDPGPLTTARATFATDSKKVAQDISANWSGALMQRAGGLSWRIQALDPGSDLEFDPKDVRIGRPQNEGDARILEEMKRRVRSGAEGRRLAYDDVKLQANQFVKYANQLRREVGEPARKKLETLATDMRDQGDRKTTSFCLDIGLSEEMTKAAKSIAAIEDVAPIEFQSVEGAEATRFAAMNLGRHAIQFLSGLFRFGATQEVPAPETQAQPVGEETPNAVKQRAMAEEALTPLSEEDIVALYATSAIDFALLMVSILARPRAKRRRTVISRLRKGLLGEEPSPDELIEEGKASVEAAEALAGKNEGDLKLRQKRREIREQSISEARADLSIDEQTIELDRKKRSVVAQIEGGELLDNMTKVLSGDEALARALLYALGDNIEEHNGDYYVSLAESPDSAHNQYLKRVTSYFSLDSKLGIQRVLPSDPAFSVLSQRSARSGESRKLHGVFKIEPRFGRNLLMISSRIDTAPAATPSASEEGGGTSANAQEEGPEFGLLDRAIQNLGQFVPASRAAAERQLSGSEDPSQFGLGDDELVFTRNSDRDDPGSGGADIEDALAEGARSGKQRKRGKPRKQGGSKRGVLSRLFLGGGKQESKPEKKSRQRRS